MVIKSRFFWVATGIFLIVTVAAIWQIYPPLLRQFQDNRTQSTELDGQLADAEAYSATLRSLKSQQTTLSSLYDKAQLALPEQTDSDILLLELEGMVKSLGLGPTITVPFQAAAASSTTSSATATDSGDSVKAGGAGTTKPIVTSAGGKQSFSISGNLSFAQTKAILDKLHGFARWNKITGIEINKSSDAYNTTITAEFFSKAAPTATFAGSSGFLDSAKKAFDSLTSYTTTPDATTEGSYGKTNPFD